MTGQCYYCAKGEHYECQSQSCICCGERNREQQRTVDELEVAMRQYLNRKTKAGIYDVDELRRKLARSNNEVVNLLIDNSQSLAEYDAEQSESWTPETARRRIGGTFGT